MGIPSKFIMGLGAMAQHPWAIGAPPQCRGPRGRWLASENPQQGGLLKACMGSEFIRERSLDQPLAGVGGSKGS